MSRKLKNIMTLRKEDKKDKGVELKKYLIS